MSAMLVSGHWPWRSGSEGISGKRLCDHAVQGLKQLIEIHPVDSGAVFEGLQFGDLALMAVKLEALEDLHRFRVPAYNISNSHVSGDHIRSPSGFRLSYGTQDFTLSFLPAKTAPPPGGRELRMSLDYFRLLMARSIRSIPSMMLAMLVAKDNLAYLSLPKAMPGTSATLASSSR